MGAKGFETPSHRAFFPDFRGNEPAFATVRAIPHTLVRMRLLPFLLPLALVGLLTAAQAQSLDAASRAALEQAAVKALQQRYILPERLAQLPERLEVHRATLDAAPDAPAYAQVLGQVLEALTQDRHVRVSYSPTPLPADLSHTEGSVDDERRHNRFVNQGVMKVERLPGNLGCLDLRAFTERRQSKPKLDAAMALLADTEALIVDLRHNGGGHPQTVAYFSSFFLKPRVHLNDMVWRTAWGESRESFHTERVGLQYDKPVWLLISPRSFSAAEGFAHNLQQLQRVQIAGQPSGGGAHPGGMHKIGAHFSLFAASGRSVNPTTGGNWEGVGVQPDVALPVNDDALRVAQLRLLEQIKTQGLPNPDSRYQRGLEARIQELQAAAPKS
jgi:hypothetical protein